MALALLSQAAMSPRIVLIEDDDDIRDSLTDLLESEGYKVDAYPNGKEALDSLSQGRDREPSVILLDLMMPVMDGFQFLKARRKFGDTITQVPTYVVSAVANQEILQGQDISGYLNKPLDIENLLQIIEVHGSRGPEKADEKPFGAAANSRPPQAANQPAQAEMVS